jgi:hypothetical protein
VTGRISTQHRDFAGCEIVIGGDDLELVFLDLLVAGLVDSWADIGIERADLPGDRFAFNRSMDGPAIGVTQHHDRLGAKYRGPVFQAGDNRRGSDVAGNPGNKNISDALIEDQLDRHSRTADDPG